MRRMLDSVDARAIPTNVEMVAGYVDGLYAWSPQDWARFPNSVKVMISAVGNAVTQVADVEVGCIWPPANAVPWVRRARAAGFDPTIYVNEVNDWGPCRAAFAAAGEPEPHWWVANYNGDPSIPDGAVARQYKHPGPGPYPRVPTVPWETGEHFDESSVRDDWPGVDGAGEFTVSASDQVNQMHASVSRVFTETGKDWSQILIQMDQMYLSVVNVFATIGVDWSVAIVAMYKWAEANGFEAIEGKLNEDQVVAKLAPMLLAAATKLSDEQLSELINDINDERGRRELARLEVQP